MMDGLGIRIGDVPVRSIRVLSTSRIEVVTRGGRPGRHEVVGTDRYDNETRLTLSEGFGYGLNRIRTQGLADVYPSDVVVVDHNTGLALTNGGLLVDGYFWRDLGGGRPATRLSRQG